MSHFTVMVIGAEPEKQLAPYDENLEMDRYVSRTKEQLIADVREEIENMKNGKYAEYLADPKKYENACTNPNHITFLQNEFPKRLEWSEQEMYNYAIRWVEPENITPDGGEYSTMNPKSKWDWYSLGGRWTGMLKLKDHTKGIVGKPGIMTNPAEPGWVDQALKKDIDFEGMLQSSFEEASKRYDDFEREYKKGKLGSFDAHWEYNVENKGTKDNFIPETREEHLKRSVGFSTFAVVKDGEWYERGSMGWWGCVSDEKPEGEWDQQFKQLLQSIPDDTLISIFDCHI